MEEMVMNNKIIKQPPLFTSLSELHQAIDRMFEPTWLERNNWLSNVVTSNWTPTIDVKEEKNQYVITADIPGVEPKNIDVIIDKGLLTIKGHKEIEKKEENENYVHVERSQGTFYRTISLPNAADHAKINAKTKNGVLKIIVPKAKGSKTHKIRIKEE